MILPQDLLSYIHVNCISRIPSNIFWLVVSTPPKNMKISWGYYSQYMKSHKIPWFQTTN